MHLSDYERRVQRGFARREQDGLAYFTVPDIEACGRYVHGFTSRLGGVSPAPYASLNLSMTREASTENKRRNYRRAAAALGLDPASLVLVNYEHGDGIARVSPKDAGKGFARPTDLPKCDALLVAEPGVAAVTLHADCVPVFCVDRRGTQGAVCHAGWKGAAKRLPQKLAERLISAGSRREDLIVGIGPHIRSCCFEVSEDVRDIFAAEFGPDVIDREVGPKAFISLERALLLQLADAGLAPEQITVAADCTYCREDLFYSHRRDHGQTGAMGAFLALK